MAYRHWLAALLLAGWMQGEALGACSQYHGRATINEVHRQGNTTRFVEVKLLDTSINPSVFGNWRVSICNAGGACSGQLALSQADAGDFPWIVIPYQLISSQFLIDLGGGMDVLFSDNSGRTIDYLSVGDHHGQRDPDCEPAYPWQHSTTNSFTVLRSPDGTGDWIITGPGASGEPPSAGEPNDDPSGPDGTPVPVLDVQNVNVAKGEPALFQVTLSEARNYDVSVAYETLDDTALAGTHYLPRQGVLTIPAGSTSADVVIHTLAYPGGEDVYFYLFLSNPQNATLHNHFAVGEILGTAPALHHVELGHSGHGLSCQSEPVLLRACADAECASLHTEPVTVTLSLAGHWVGGDSHTITGGETEVRLRRTQPGGVVLALADGTAYRCLTPAGEDCRFVMHEAGFQLDIPRQTSCQTSAPLMLGAVKADPLDPERCIRDDGFAGTGREIVFHRVFDSPASGTAPLQVNGQSIAGSPTAIALAFDAEAQAAIEVRYDDAGRIALHAFYAGSGEEAGLEMRGDSMFVVAPHSLGVVAQPAGSEWIAGEPFDMTVTAQCADGSITGNFALDGMAADHALVAPAGGAPGALGTGLFDITGGQASIAQSISEVGEFTLTVQTPAAGYFGEPLPVASSAPIGPFRPAHYALIASELLPALNLTDCGPAQGTEFSYAGQPFGGSFTLEARNALGTRTANYRDAYVQLTDPAAALVVENDQTGAPYDLVAMEVVEGAGFSDGVTGQARIALQVRWDMPQQAPATSTASLSGNGVVIHDAPRVLGGSEVRRGRLALANAHGSELLPLDLPVAAHYFDGTGYIGNGADHCTSVSAAALLLEDFQGGLSAAALEVSGTATLSGGVGALRLARPGAPGVGPGVRGSAELELCLDASAACNAGGVAGAALPWLQFDWNGAGGAGNPRARASFGLYRGSERVIYLREALD